MASLFKVWTPLPGAPGPVPQGICRYAEIVVFADSLGEAAVNCVIFKMMGFADVKVWAA